VNTGELEAALSEADFLPCSYGFRPNCRAHDAVAEVRHLTSRPRCYEWVVEGDIKVCFDEISHAALMERVRARVGDKRVLTLVNRLSVCSTPTAQTCPDSSRKCSAAKIDHRATTFAIRPGTMTSRLTDRPLVCSM
jgi:hypothetical protein